MIVKYPMLVLVSVLVPVPVPCFQMLGCLLGAMKVEIALEVYGDIS